MKFVRQISRVGEIEKKIFVWEPIDESGRGRRKCMWKAVLNYIEKTCKMACPPGDDVL